MITYYLYHVPGVKIGVTVNIKRRVIEQQGYNESQFEILEESDNIDYISKREIELQTAYGYAVETILYSNLMIKLKKEKNMGILVNGMAASSGPTTKTVTLYKDISEAAPHIVKMGVGHNIIVQGNEHKLDASDANWISKNLLPSKFQEGQCYFFVNAFNKHLADKSTPIKPNLPEGAPMFNDIRKWADDRDLIESGDVKTQYIKLGEEFGELGRSIIKSDDAEFKDAIGDMVVVLTNLCAIKGQFLIEQAIDSAYETIKNRKGKIVNGSFIKE